MAIDKITTPAVTDDSVTLAKMAPGTDGNIISYDASGNPVAVATGTAGQILTSAGAGAPPTFATAASSNPYTALSVGQSGYITLVGGLIIQWGVFGTFGTASTGTVTYPLTFPNNFYGITTSMWVNNTNNYYALSLKRPVTNKAQFEWYQGDTSNTGRVGSYIATGN